MILANDNLSLDKFLFLLFNGDSKAGFDPNQVTLKEVREQIQSHHSHHMKFRVAGRSVRGKIIYNIIWPEKASDFRHDN